MLDVNKWTTTRRQYFGSTTDLAKNIKSAISACKSSSGLEVL